MQEINPSSVVRLRPGIIILVISILLIIMGTVFFNLASSSSNNAAQDSGYNNQSMRLIASDRDTSWYEHETTRKTNKVESVMVNGASKRKEDVVIDDKKEEEISGENQQALLEAMKAPITSNQLTNNQLTVDNASMPNTLSQGTTTSASGIRSNDQNMQGEKRAFIDENNHAEDDYLHSMAHDPISRFVIQTGTIISGSLITGINSDLPGQIIGQVQSNVYDSISGKYLLIPQGSKVQGVYDSQVVYGQERVLIVWKRIIFPNGQSLNLEGMPGVDMSGYTGFKDQVNNHYSKLLASVLLMSGLSAGAQLSQPPQSNSPFASPTVGQTLAQSLGTNIANVGTMMTSKNLNIQPTIEIRPGYQFNINVVKDILFKKPYDDNT